MPNIHIVSSGDCIASIAESAGLFWETIWLDGANAEIRQTRKDPNQLVPGDKVSIPDMREKHESVPTDSTHRFVRRGVPSKLRLRLLQEGEPVANQPFRADIDGAMSRGTTDADGVLEIEIPGTALRGTLYVGPEADLLVYKLDLGQLEPVSTIKGVKQRLKNMGFDVGVLDDEVSEEFKLALMQFQAEQNLESDGSLNDATKLNLEKVFGR